TDETERMPLRAMERVMDVASTDPEAALRFARLEDRDANKRRAALETALAAHPDNAALLDALANYRLDRGEGWAALELARKARASSPQSIDPMLTEARALDGVGLSARAGRSRAARAARPPPPAAEGRLGRAGRVHPRAFAAAPEPGAARAGPVRASRGAVRGGLLVRREGAGEAEAARRRGRGSAGGP